MTWRNKVDIMTTTVLEVQHDLCKSFRLDLISCITLTDIIVLAVLTVEIARCEENRSRAMPAPQGVFLPQVGAETAYSGPLPGTADSNFSSAAVNVTLPGTDITHGEMFKSLGDTLCEFVRIKQFQVSGLKVTDHIYILPEFEAECQ
jgi:hypothetical protein